MQGDDFEMFSLHLKRVVKHVESRSKSNENFFSYCLSYKNAHLTNTTRISCHQTNKNPTNGIEYNRDLKKQMNTKSKMNSVKSKVYNIRNLQPS